ncbi:hypothetical protein EYC84_001284 [Monilinia fructicola]|uniref:Uncharacterized protein n=1 Tax=Monilinia fructicola TaxID=38448 RepID=A0A5M9JK83_MONFR|nr:hypothetical protein EYC84_001284 [Monilinia fructicola]
MIYSIILPSTINKSLPFPFLILPLCHSYNHRYRFDYKNLWPSIHDSFSVIKSNASSKIKASEAKIKNKINSSKPLPFHSKGKTPLQSVFVSSKDLMTPQIDFSLLTPFHLQRMMRKINSATHPQSQTPTMSQNLPMARVHVCVYVCSPIKADHRPPTRQTHGSYTGICMCVVIMQGGKYVQRREGNKEDHTGNFCWCIEQYIIRSPKRSLGTCRTPNFYEIRYGLDMGQNMLQIPERSHAGENTSEIV